ncbi:MAG: hypothetical protein HQ503_05130 [Rhodospirillales bacterium]|nr:hypothetical protein [Rhodospirillales bacterium]
MKVRRFFYICLVGFVSALVYANKPVYAESFLQGDALRATFADKTITFPNKNGSSTSIVYFGKDGTMIAGNSERKDLRLTGKWFVKKNGFFTGPMELLCRRYDGRPERCMKVTIAGDTVKFVSLKDKPAYEAKIKAGQHIP